MRLLELEADGVQLNVNCLNPYSTGNEVVGIVKNGWVQCTKPSLNPYSTGNEVVGGVLNNIKSLDQKVLILILLEMRLLVRGIDEKTQRKSPVLILILLEMRLLVMVMSLLLSQKEMS